MKRLLLLSLLIAQPVFANDYLGFAPGESQSTTIFESPTAPIVGVNCPANWTIVEWIRSNQDDQPSHYTLIDGQLSYNPPKPPIPIPQPPQPVQPDVIGFLMAVNSDSLITANNYALAFQLAGLLALMQADLQAIPVLGSAANLQAHWSAAVTNFGSSWLTSPVQQMILGYAQQYNIPLVAQ